MELCVFLKGAASLKAWGRWALHKKVQGFSVRLSHKPTPTNFPHSSSDLLLQMKLLVPTFHFRGKRENGKNSSAFMTNSSGRCSKLLHLLFLTILPPFTGKLTVKLLRPSEALKQIKFVFACVSESIHSPLVCQLLFNWLIFLTNIKGKISLCNIMHFNGLLSLSDLVAGWWQQSTLLAHNKDESRPTDTFRCRSFRTSTKMSAI